MIDSLSQYLYILIVFRTAHQIWSHKYIQYLLKWIPKSEYLAYLRANRAKYYFDDYKCFARAKDVYKKFGYKTESPWVPFWILKKRRSEIEQRRRCTYFNSNLDKYLSHHPLITVFLVFLSLAPIPLPPPPIAKLKGISAKLEKLLHVDNVYLQNLKYRHGCK